MIPKLVQMRCSLVVLILRHILTQEHLHLVLMHHSKNKNIMVKKYISKTVATFFIGCTLIAQGCDSVFEELAINPNQPSMSSYFTTPEGVNDAVLTMYGYISTQRCLGASGSKTQIIRSDEASSNSDYGKPGMYGTDMNASYYTIEQPYTLMYTTASQASYIIETAPEVNFDNNEELRNAYIGEAHFWRAFSHYYLLINFRNISPIRQMPRNAEDYVRPLEEPAAVWDFIQEDLAKAKELLPLKGYWKSTDMGRVTKATAAALSGNLSRWPYNLSAAWRKNPGAFGLRRRWNWRSGTDPPCGNGHKRS